MRRGSVTRSIAMLGWLSLSVTMLASPASAATHVVILVDDSGSMENPLRANPRVRKIDAAKEALYVALEEVSGDAEIGLLALNSTTSGQGEWLIPLTAEHKGPLGKGLRPPATSAESAGDRTPVFNSLDREAVREAIGRLNAAGGTPLGRAMKVAADALLQRRAERRFGDYRLLIVTDGEANDQYLVDLYLPRIIARGLTVDAIGVDMATRHSLATQVDTYRDADDPATLRQAIQEVLAESNADDDGGVAEEDFRLLAAIPEEMCVQLIQTLQAVDNSPIASTEADSSSHPPALFPAGQTSPFGKPAGQKREGSWAILFLIILAFFVLANLKSRLPRHRR